MRPTNVRFIVLFGLCLAAGLAYVHRVCLSVVAKTAGSNLDITPGEMGWLFGAFFWTYALFQIPTGLLVDRWGPRRALFLFGLLGAATVAMASAVLLVEAAVGFTILLVSRVLMGIAQAGLFPASTRAIATWFPLERRAFASGTLQACMSLGSAGGAFVTAQLLGVVDWPWVFLIYAVPGVIWSFWFFAWFRDRPTEHPGTNAAEQILLAPGPVAASTERTSFLSLMTDWPVVLLCSQQFCRAAANVFWMTWCPTYLINVHGVSEGHAGRLTALPICGVVLGSLFGGFLSDRVLKQTGSLRLSRAGVSMSTAFVGVLVFTLVYFVPAGEVALAITLIATASFFTSGGNPSAYSAAMDLGGKNLAAVFGAMNMWGNLGAFAFSLVVPVWMGWFGWPAVVLLVGGLYAAGIVLWWPLDPGRTRDVAERADYS